jgi:hypothetical protein
MMIWDWLFVILGGTANDSLWTRLSSLLVWLITGSMLFGLVALTPGCSAQMSTPTASGSPQTTATIASASHVQPIAGPSSLPAYATGWDASQPGSSPSRWPVILSLSPIDWIVLSLLSGGSGGLAGGVAASKVALRRMRSNGQ